MENITKEMHAIAKYYNVTISELKLFMEPVTFNFNHDTNEWVIKL